MEGYVILEGGSYARLLFGFCFPFNESEDHQRLVQRLAYGENQVISVTQKVEMRAFYEMTEVSL